MFVSALMAVFCVNLHYMWLVPVNCLSPLVVEDKLCALITSAEEGGYVFDAVCLSVRRITRKLVNGF